MKSCFITGPVCAFGIVLGGCTTTDTNAPQPTPTTTSQPQVTTQTATLATDDQIRSAIIGNSLEGTWIDKSKYNEFYNPNGTFTGYSFEPNNTKYSGTWKISQNQICNRWKLTASGKTYSGCYQFLIESETVTLYKKGKPMGVTATVLPGNPFGY